MKMTTVSKKFGAMALGAVLAVTAMVGGTVTPANAAKTAKANKVYKVAVDAKKGASLNCGEMESHTGNMNGLTSHADIYIKKSVVDKNKTNIMTKAEIADSNYNYIGSTNNVNITVKKSGKQYVAKVDDKKSSAVKVSTTGKYVKISVNDVKLTPEADNTKLFSKAGIANLFYVITTGAKTTAYIDNVGVAFTGDRYIYDGNNKKLSIINFAIDGNPELKIVKFNKNK
ncbi:hypothetical protein SAMN02910400_02655 [Lachnospiraceae bacterium C10]|nr:hypothetical protein SAMN02910400_02655 [Lachnospiraceae bacterium C10]